MTNSETAQVLADEHNSLRTPQGEPALTQTDGLPGTREPVVTAPQGNAGESPAHLSAVLFRAAGWLAAPRGESLGSSIQLITDLVAEVKLLRPSAGICEHGYRSTFCPKCPQTNATETGT